MTPYHTNIHASITQISMDLLDLHSRRHLCVREREREREREIERKRERDREREIERKRERDREKERKR